MSTKGSGPRKGHNAEKQRKNYDDIDWSKKPLAPKTEQPKHLELIRILLLTTSVECLQIFRLTLPLW